MILLIKPFTYCRYSDSISHRWMMELISKFLSEFGEGFSQVFSFGALGYLTGAICLVVIGIAIYSMAVAMVKLLLGADDGN